GMLVVLASAQPDTKLTILEVAVSAINSPGFGHMRLVNPDIAIITNIGDAHLKPGQTSLHTAQRKTNIFSSMKPGAVALICHDSEHFGFMADRALQAGLVVRSYGEHPQSDIRL